MRHPFVLIRRHLIIGNLYLEELWLSLPGRGSGGLDLVIPFSFVGWRSRNTLLISPFVSLCRRNARNVTIFLLSPFHFCFSIQIIHLRPPWTVASLFPSSTLFTSPHSLTLFYLTLSSFPALSFSFPYTLSLSLYSSSSIFKLCLPLSHPFLPFLPFVFVILSTLISFTPLYRSLPHSSLCSPHSSLPSLSPFFPFNLSS